MNEQCYDEVLNMNVNGYLCKDEMNKTRLTTKHDEQKTDYEMNWG